MIEKIALLLFPLLMAFAASSDLLTMKIPNRVSIILVAGYLGFAALVGTPLEAIGLNLLCGLLVLSVTFTMFCFGWMGGGDAKLAAASSVWLGWGLVLEYAVAAAMLGGLLTLIILVGRKWPLPLFLHRQTWAARLHAPETGIPYGIALAAAGLILYPYTGVWLAATAA